MPDSPPPGRPGQGKVEASTVPAQPQAPHDGSLPQRPDADHRHPPSTSARLGYAAAAGAAVGGVLGGPVGLALGLKAGTLAGLATGVAAGGAAAAGRLDGETLAARARAALPALPTVALPAWVKRRQPAPSPDSSNEEAARECGDQFYRLPPP